MTDGSVTWSFAAGESDKPVSVRRLAEVICSSAFGDWGTADVELRAACVCSAEAALLCLDQHGLGLTLLDAHI